MILSLRGASGSGKSTLARQIMERARLLRGAGESCWREGRKKPIGYRIGRLMVLGHYEIANGGMDTVELPLAYELVEEWAASGHDVLCEGKTLRDNARSAIELSKKFPVTVLHLVLDPDECVERIRRRRGPSGAPHNIAPRSVLAMARKCASDAAIMREAGVSCVSVSPEAALPLALRALGLEGRP